MVFPRLMFGGALFISSSLLAACGADEQASTSDVGSDVGSDVAAELNPQAIEGELEVDAQGSDGTRVVVEEVELEETNGFVAIHRDNNGVPGGVVGQTALEEGEHEDVAVALTEPVTTGTYWAMLHIDAGAPGVYEFPGADVPLVDDADVVQESFALTVR